VGNFLMAIGALDTARALFEDAVTTPHARRWHG